MKRALRPTAYLFLLVLLGALKGHSALALDITGPSRVCPGQTVSFTVTSFPAIYVSWKLELFNDGAAFPAQTWNRSPSDSKTISVTFLNTTGASVLKATATSIGASYVYIKDVARAGVTPPPPNNGLVIGCSANQEVAISSTPSLQNNATDCFFHCRMEWSAPSGWTLKNSAGYSNPANGATHVKFPSGLSNGNVGNITVTAIYTECTPFVSNTSSTATLWYGPPIITSSNQTLFDGPSNVWHCSITNNPMGGASATWSLVSGDASFSTSGYANYISSVNGGTIQVVLTNACGSSSTQYFNIPPAGSSLMAYPNPAKNSLSIQFRNTESPDFLPKTLNIISESHQRVVKSISVTDVFSKKSFVDGNKINIDVKDLPRGVYYLHAIPDENSKIQTEKTRIVLE
ncbi:T9SS type A sorting domain-containing protein [Dyadobacter sp. CY261]|uniref:T9SS type A sorting domain-containing protein n=1 Tax=Dyadobacter sp. CY261 TaxID=2907203 RepID=UPI001F39FB54|nr:T9SS type A sorting domain-containing protein [Dyadobacter sp. CY261]MCF0074112.1 T9SS type A sorting domain-containing protein [Dyadobacter sp. CY261]